MIHSKAMRIELHCHSTCSDGDLTPAAVAALAIGRNLAVFALTDHDTCDGTDAAVVGGAQVLRGVEISCQDDGHNVHLLAYGHAGQAWASLETALLEVREARRRRLRMMAAKLEQRGVRVDVEALLAEAGKRAVGRPDLARAMVDQRVVTSMKEAFNRFLYDGGPVDVPHRAWSLADALRFGRAAGARMSLAHPHQYRERAVPMLKKYRAEGLEGVEVFYGGYDAGDRAKWLAIAREHDLIATGGSDFHRPGDPQLGIDFPEDDAANLCAWLGVS